MSEFGGSSRRNIPRCFLNTHTHCAIFVFRQLCTVLNDRANEDLHASEHYVPFYLPQREGRPRAQHTFTCPGAINKLLVTKRAVPIIVAHSLTLEMRRGCPTSAPPCMRNPQGEPPSRTTSLAVMSTHHTHTHHPPQTTTVTSLSCSCSTTPSLVAPLHSTSHPHPTAPNRPTDRSGLSHPHQASPLALLLHYDTTVRATSPQRDQKPCLIYETRSTWIALTSDVPFGQRNGIDKRVGALGQGFSEWAI